MIASPISLDGFRKSIHSKGDSTVSQRLMAQSDLTAKAANLPNSSDDTDSKARPEGEGAPLRSDVWWPGIYVIREEDRRCPRWWRRRVGESLPDLKKPVDRRGCRWALKKGVCDAFVHSLTETGRVAAKSCRWIRRRSTRTPNRERSWPTVFVKPALVLCYSMAVRMSLL